MDLVMNEMSLSMEIELYRAEAPDHRSNVIAVDADGRMIEIGDNGPRYALLGGEVDDAEMINATIRACKRIWPGKWGEGYKQVFDANPAKITRRLPPVPILKVIAWAASQNSPSEMGAALVAVSKGVDAGNIIAARLAFQYAER